RRRPSRRPLRPRHPRAAARNGRNGGLGHCRRGGSVGFSLEMARAAAKRGQRSTPPAPPPRRPRGATPKSVEETLFFNRLRNHAKWVFVVLAVAIAGGLVVFGVGSGG